jgi:hypothetical protein
MAGIDNTVLFEILKQLYPGKVTDKTIYDALLLTQPENNFERGHAATKYAGQMKLGKDVRGKGYTKAVFWPKDQRWIERIKETDREYETAAYWADLSTPERRAAQRFPVPGLGSVSFDSHLYDVLLGLIRDRKDAFAVMERVCRDWGIPDREIQPLRDRREDPEKLACCLVETARKASTGIDKQETQRSLKDRLPPVASPPPPVVSPPPVCPAPPGRGGTPARPTAPAHRPARSLPDGAVFSGAHPDPSFPPRADHEADPLAALYHSVPIGGREILLPYKEVLGGGKKGRQEYTEGKNLTIQYARRTAEIRAHVPSLDYKAEFRREMSEAARRGYTKHPPKLWLLQGKEWKDREALTLTFGKIGYLDHRLYRKELDRDGAERQAFENAASQPRGWSAALDGCLWAACGGGCWVITSDGFLVLSFRSPVLVAEVPGRLSYSASGSYDRYRDKKPTHGDNTPARAMAAELWEELGLPKPEPEELTLINLGIDLERYLSQLSYVWRCPYTAAQVRHCRREYEAVDANEQKILFVPFQREACAAFLLHYEFEPGAAFSLRRLLEKEFGAL